MSKPAKKASRKVVLTLSDEAVKLLDAMARKAPGRSRGEVLESALLGSSGPDDLRGRRRRSEAVREFLRLADSAKAAGKASRQAGRREKDFEAFLMAASYEVRALAFESDPTEAKIRSTLIQALLLLRDAAGYRRLPDLPESVGRVDAVQ